MPAAGFAHQNTKVGWPGDHGEMLGDFVLLLSVAWAGARCGLDPAMVTGANSHTMPQLFISPGAARLPAPPLLKGCRGEGRGIYKTHCLYSCRRCAGS